MSRFDRRRLDYMLDIVRQGPTETGYAYFRARRRRRNLSDRDSLLSESDLLALTGAFDYDHSQLAAHRQVVEAYHAMQHLDIRSVQWFLPYFSHAYFGGVHTILRFADRFAREHGVENRFCLYDSPSDPKVIRGLGEKIGDAFPALAPSEVTGPVVGGHEPFEHLRDSDAAIATLWTSAYPLLRYNRTRAKLFFLQDYEPLFYAASAASALVDETYRFGIPGIVNTPGLAAAYRRHGNDAVSFLPAVDPHYAPPSAPRPGEPVRIFFYGRPGTPRNGFGLGMAALAKVKERFGDRVDIVCAGEDWSEGALGVAGRVRNLGRLGSLEEVASLYRTCDIGLVFMFTKHPSYQPFEFMASGMATVSNENEDTRWFLRDGENCLLAPAAPTLVADAIGHLVEDRQLRDRLAASGRREVESIGWGEQIDRVWSAITNPAAAAWDDPELPGRQSSSAAFGASRS